MKVTKEFDNFDKCFKCMGKFMGNKDMRGWTKCLHFGPIKELRQL